MSRTRLTRRRALQLGAAAVASTATRPAASLAAAGPAPTSFALDLSSALPRAGAGARAAGHSARRTTLPPARAPHRFDLIGADWNAGAHVHVEVRARRDGGRWSSWVPLPSGGDHAPDDGGRRDASASEPVWTGTADVFQLRYRGTARRLRARFVRASPDAAAIRRAPRARRARARRTGAGPTAHAATRATASATQPNVIFRGEWGADRYPPRSAPLVGDVQMGFVHHTVTANAYGPEDSAAIVLGILRYHRDHNGWNDIGYNFLVDQYGQVFEGRAGGIDQAIVGAQAQGWNAHSTGVATLGDYSAAAFPAAGAEAVAALLAWKLPLHGVPVTGTVDIVSAGGAANRYPSGRTIRFERISGHRDGCTTSCPGDALYATLPTLRARALQLAGDLTTGLTLRAERSTLELGQALAVTGALRFTDGTSPAGRTVQLEHQPASGQPWRALSQLPVDPVSGAFAGDVAVPGTGRVRATTGDDGVHGVLASSPVRVKVLPRLGLKLSPRTTRPGRRVRVRATVDGSRATKAQLLVERRIRGMTYRRVQTRRLRISRGRVGATVRPRAHGTYRVTVRVAGEQIKRLLRVR